jgi:drug/metabolite transporter (DMT)-like permease
MASRSKFHSILWLYNQPYILLVVTTLFWGGNAVAGKLAVGEVSPMAITFLRWVISCVALAFLAHRQIAAEWRVLLPAWPYILAMAGLGFTAFNALYYASAHYTTAVNIAIIQGSTPVFVLIGGLLLGIRLNPPQVAGVLLTLSGAVLVASRADPSVLYTLNFNIGDTWLLIASMLYAFYILALPRKPKVSAIVFFAGLAAAACLTSIPLVLIEALMGWFTWPSAFGWVVLLYIALFPSLLCQVLYIRAIELIGASRASTFYNLAPVFGALLSATLLDEQFAVYHVIGLALVLGGIALAERNRR